MNIWPKGDSEPEADSLRDKSNVLDGWLWSLTFAFGGIACAFVIPIVELL